jgi:acetaldehyde dehydrogenase/alcohol dehydrogenase
VALFLPYTIQFTANGAESRYGDIATFLGLPARDESEGAANLIAAIVQLERQLKQPTTVGGVGISAGTFEEALPALIANAESDTQLVTSVRIPDSTELAQLFRCAFEGRPVDF